DPGNGQDVDALVRALRETQAEVARLRELIDRQASPVKSEHDRLYVATGKLALNGADELVSYRRLVTFRDGRMQVGPEQVAEKIKLEGLGGEGGPVSNPTYIQNGPYY